MTLCQQNIYISVRLSVFQLCVTGLSGLSGKHLSHSVSLKYQYSDHLSSSFNYCEKNILVNINIYIYLPECGKGAGLRKSAYRGCYRIRIHYSYRYRYEKVHRASRLGACIRMRILWIATQRKSRGLVLFCNILYVKLDTTEQSLDSGIPSPATPTFPGFSDINKPENSLCIVSYFIKRHLFA